MRPCAGDHPGARKRRPNGGQVCAGARTKGTGPVERGPGAFQGGRFMKKGKPPPIIPRCRPLRVSMPVCDRAMMDGAGAAWRQGGVLSRAGFKRLYPGVLKKTTHHAITGRPAIIKNTISSNRDTRPNERGSRMPTDIRAKTTTPPKRQAQMDNRILLLTISPVGPVVTVRFDTF